MFILVLFIYLFFGVVFWRFACGPEFVNKATNMLRMFQPWSEMPGA